MTAPAATTLPGMDAATALARVVAWLDAAPNRERTGNFAGLHTGVMRQVLDLLPPPPAPVTFAGTKGKGSTLHLVEVGLRALGRPTVAFTSPHVRRVTERWRLDGQDIDGRDLAAVQPAAAAAEASAGTALSWFERSLALAAVLAAQRPQATFLCEVGIGGRQDATNALDAGVAVVTHLSHDHRDVLGPTLDDIAHQKLGIARPGRPLVIAPQTQAGEAAIRRRLAAGDAAGAHVTWVRRDQTWDLGLPGAHQQDNAATAAAVLAAVAPGHDQDPVRRAWAATSLPARCQFLQAGGRSLLVDGAHNGPSIAATLQVAQAAFPQGFTVILALARDKEVDEVLAAIPETLAVHRCGYASTRARDVDAWPARARAWPWHADVGQALAATTGPVCITGSFYVAAEALERLG